MLGLGELFGKTWGIYKRRALTLILILILTGVIAVVAGGVSFGLAMLLGVAVEPLRRGVAAGGTVVAVIAAVIASFWGQCAFVLATADEGLGLKEAFGAAWRRIGSYCWVYLVMVVIIAGGYLLLLIPGVLFTVWFVLGVFVFAREDLRGMSALMKAREYVRGNGFGVFLRLLAVYAISLALGLVPIAGSIFSIIYAPFLMLFSYLLYEDLRRVRGEFAFVATTGGKAKWIVLGLLGYVVFPVAVLLITGAAVLGGALLVFRAQFGP